MLKEGETGNMPLSSLSRISRKLPTLLISECCLCYLSVDDAKNVLQYFQERHLALGVILYEPTHPNDDFGQMMFKNLASRNISMPTVVEHPTLERQQERMFDAGFEHDAQVADIDFLWEHWIGDDEKERVNRLEGLDEVEEWQLLARHYAIVWAWSQQFPPGSGNYGSGKEPSLHFKEAWYDLACMNTDRNEHGVAEQRTEETMKRRMDDCPGEWY